MTDRHIAICGNDDRFGNSIKTLCHGCKTPIVVSPGTYKDVGPDGAFLCFSCGFKEIGEAKKAGDTPEVRVGPNQLIELAQKRKEEAQ